MKRLIILAMGLGLVVGCSSAKIHGDKKVVAQGGSRPSWVADTGARTQKQLADVVGHEAGEYHYLVAEASVEPGEQNLPTCYEFASANGSHEVAAELYTEIKGSTATAADEGSRSQYSESIKMIQGKVVGAQVLAKHWETIESKDQEQKTFCWIIQGIPTKNYTNLKKFAEDKLRNASAGPASKRVKKAVQKNQDSETAPEQE